jgi:hypothetical protein
MSSISAAASMHPTKIPDAKPAISPFQKAADFRCSSLCACSLLNGRFFAMILLSNLCQKMKGSLVKILMENLCQLWLCWADIFMVAMLCQS